MKALLAIVLSLGTVAGLLTIADYPREAVLMAGIFVLAAALWVTEALPLFVTALLVIGLQMLVLANPGGWPFLGSPASGITVQSVVNGAADSVLLLFLGGFVLAAAAERADVGRFVSARLLAPFSGHPARLLLGVMIVTACFSMWMSNTATTALMIAVLAPQLSTIPTGEAYRKGLMLAVPFAANIGGLGTPVSSPPNAVALGYLQKAGYSITFLEWMLVAVPLMAGLLAFTWLLLWRSFPSTSTAPLVLESAPLSRRGAFVMTVFGITVLLWLTGGLHGVPPAVVALLPIVAMTATRILTERDVNGLDWTVLILISGGISLGAGMQTSGLDDIVTGWLGFDAGDSPRLVAATLVATVLVVGTFMSNTAVANLLLPVGVSAGIASASPDAVVDFTFTIALAASCAMSLPISTPPNALAYSRGIVTTRDMARIGIIVGGTAGVLIVAFGPPVMRFWGVL
jgi:solute carrier family 13 (sodium-dependent dicarboxylate transporter), member 2/3/5